MKYFTWSTEGYGAVMSPVSRSAREALLRWGTTIVALGLLGFGGPDIVSRFSADITATDWIVLAVYAAATVDAVKAAVRSWMRKLGRSEEDLETGYVANSDVESALANSTYRVSAVRALRERHPGLGLLEATRMIDERIRSQ